MRKISERKRMIMIKSEWWPDDFGGVKWGVMAEHEQDMSLIDYDHKRPKR